MWISLNYLKFFHSQVLPFVVSKLVATC